VGPDAVAPYGGRAYLADTSAWAAGRDPAVRRDWAAALRGGQIATTPVVRLELLYAARSAEELDAIGAECAQLRDVPITRSVTNAALGAYRQLARGRPLAHRAVRTRDLLVAAAAQDAGLGVLHYDAGFDVLATVLGFESRWIAPAGSL